MPPEKFYHLSNPGTYLEFNITALPQGELPEQTLVIHICNSTCFTTTTMRATLVVHSYIVISCSTTTTRPTRATREERMVGLLSSADVSRLLKSQASTRCVGSTGFQYKRKMEIKNKLCINQMCRINRFHIREIDSFLKTQDTYLLKTNIYFAGKSCLRAAVRTRTIMDIQKLSLALW